ncbi:hypothetical protein GM921_09915 [Pedobacter sp. LMG 31464]|uniref:Uncharacterized protein n=1 Tax=Pedobacter planticolens TaxID=2679964 RepID=A0A923E0F5_9SPHI|nr:hypothetical protein [Pedobacter planticolens]MBB2145803.1 hypothetical protein [Pedobacter planticolens]
MKNLKNKLPLFAFLLGLAIVVSQSAFRPIGSSKLADVIFEYNSSTYTEGAYLTDTNWEVTEDGSQCPGSGNICKLSVDELELSGIGTMEEQLVEFLDNQPGTNGATDYIEDIDHRVADKD